MSLKKTKKTATTTAKPCNLRRKTNTFRPQNMAFFT